MFPTTVDSKKAKDKKPQKHVFENMTIHKQYVEYNDIKDTMAARLKSVNNMSTVHMIIGVVYMIYLVVSIFLESIQEPVAVLLGHKFIFGKDLGDKVVEGDQGWEIYIFKITAFMLAINFLVVGTYIAYYKSVVKVDTMR